MPERPELLSTARPTPLRLWGFLTLALGALVAGIGAVLDWAVLGFPSDTTGQLDVPIKGTDVWEGKVVLAAAILALVGQLVLRTIRGREPRRAVAFALVTLGALILAVALSAALRADARFGGSEGLDQMAASLAEELDQPVDEVRAQLEDQFADQITVDLGIGIWLAAVGGLLIDVGGALNLAWVRRVAGGSEASEASRRSEAPPGEPADPGDPSAST